MDLSPKKHGIKHGVKVARHCLKERREAREFLKMREAAKEKWRHAQERRQDRPVLSKQIVRARELAHKMRGNNIATDRLTLPYRLKHSLIAKGRTAKPLHQEDLRAESALLEHEALLNGDIQTILSLNSQRGTSSNPLDMLEKMIARDRTRGQYHGGGEGEQGERTDVDRNLEGSEAMLESGNGSPLQIIDMAAGERNTQMKDTLVRRNFFDLERSEDEEEDIDTVKNKENLHRAKKNLFGPEHKQGAVLRSRRRKGCFDVSGDSNAGYSPPVQARGQQLNKLAERTADSSHSRKEGTAAVNATPADAPTSRSGKTASSEQSKIPPKTAATQQSKRTSNVDTGQTQMAPPRSTYSKQSQMLSEASASIDSTEVVDGQSNRSTAKHVALVEGEKASQSDISGDQATASGSNTPSELVKPTFLVQPSKKENIRKRQLTSKKNRIVKEDSQLFNPVKKTKLNPPTKKDGSSQGPSRVQDPSASSIFGLPITSSNTTGSCDPGSKRINIGSLEYQDSRDRSIFKTSGLETGSTTGGRSLNEELSFAGGLEREEVAVSESSSLPPPDQLDKIPQVYLHPAISSGVGYRGASHPDNAMENKGEEQRLGNNQLNTAFNLHLSNILSAGLQPEEGSVYMGGKAVHPANGSRVPPTIPVSHPWVNISQAVINDLVTNPAYCQSVSSHSARLDLQGGQGKSSAFTKMTYSIDPDYSLVTHRILDSHNCNTQELARSYSFPGQGLAGFYAPSGQGLTGFYAPSGQGLVGFYAPSGLGLAEINAPPVQGLAISYPPTEWVSAGSNPICAHRLNGSCPTEQELVRLNPPYEQGLSGLDDLSAQLLTGSYPLSEYGLPGIYPIDEQRLNGSYPQTEQVLTRSYDPSGPVAGSTPLLASYPQSGHGSTALISPSGQRFLGSHPPCPQKLYGSYLSNSKGSDKSYPPNHSLAGSYSPSKAGFLVDSHSSTHGFVTSVTRNTGTNAASLLNIHEHSTQEIRYTNVLPLHLRINPTCEYFSSDLPIQYMARNDTNNSENKEKLIAPTKHSNIRQMPSNRDNLYARVDQSTRDNSEDQSTRVYMYASKDPSTGVNEYVSENETTQFNMHASRVARCKMYDSEDTASRENMYACEDHNRRINKYKDTTVKNNMNASEDQNRRINKYEDTTAKDNMYAREDQNRRINKYENTNARNNMYESEDKNRSINKYENTNARDNMYACHISNRRINKYEDTIAKDNMYAGEDKNRRINKYEDTNARDNMDACHIQNRRINKYEDTTAKYNMYTSQDQSRRINKHEDTTAKDNMYACEDQNRRIKKYSSRDTFGRSDRHVIKDQSARVDMYTSKDIYRKVDRHASEDPTRKDIKYASEDPSMSFNLYAREDLSERADMYASENLPRRVNKYAKSEDPSTREDMYVRENPPSRSNEYANEDLCRRVDIFAREDTSMRVNMSAIKRPSRRVKEYDSLDSSTIDKMYTIVDPYRTDKLNSDTAQSDLNPSGYPTYTDTTYGAHFRGGDQMYSSGNTSTKEGVSNRQCDNSKSFADQFETICADNLYNRRVSPDDCELHVRQFLARKENLMDRAPTRKNTMYRGQDLPNGYQMTSRRLTPIEEEMYYSEPASSRGCVDENQLPASKDYY